ASLARNRQSGIPADVRADAFLHIYRVHSRLRDPERPCVAHLCAARDAGGRGARPDPVTDLFQPR
nr:hypothetical protein [Tanacetum cinerariifolium]